MSANGNKNKDVKLRKKMNKKYFTDYGVTIITKCKVV